MKCEVWECVSVCVSFFSALSCNFFFFLVLLSSLVIFWNFGIGQGPPWARTVRHRVNQFQIIHDTSLAQNLNSQDPFLHRQPWNNAKMQNPTSQPRMQLCHKLNRSYRHRRACFFRDINFFFSLFPGTRVDLHCHDTKENKKKKK